MKKIKIDKKFSILLIAIILTIVTIISIGTYALLVWDSTTSTEGNTNATIVVQEVVPICLPSLDVNISNIGPIFDYTTDGVNVYFAIDVNQAVNANIVTDAFLRIDEISDALKSKDFKYVVMSANVPLADREKSTTQYTFVSEGDFSEATVGGKLPLFENVNTLLGEIVTFKVIIYIDANVENPIAMQEKGLVGQIEACFEKEYGIDYDANGGTGAPASQFSDYDGTVKITSSVPTKPGYDFDKWNTKADGTGTSYSSGATISNIKTRIKLYAMWKLKEYTINYYLGNGTSTAGSTKITSISTKCTYGQECTLASFPSGTTFPLSDTDHMWSFAGWTNSQVSTDVLYEDGATFIYSNKSDLNLYAIGSREFKYYSGINPTSLFDSSIQYWNPHSTATSYLTSIKIPSPININTWEFIGYRHGVSDASSVVTFSADKVGTDVTPSVTSYPIVRSVYKRDLTLLFNANGGAGNVSSISSTQYYTSGYGTGDTNSGAAVSTPSFTLPTSTFTRAGYNQGGWIDETANRTYNLGAAYTGFSPEVGSSITTKTLKANWNAIVYTITYYLGNGSSTAGVTKLGTSTCTYSQDCSLTTFANLGGTFPLSSYNWSFYGWSKSQTSYERDYQNGDTFTYNMSSDVSLYAIGRRPVYFNSGINPTSYVDTMKPYQYWNPYQLSTTYASSVLVPQASSISTWTFLGYKHEVGQGVASADGINYLADKVGSYVTPAPNDSSMVRGIYSRTLSYLFDGNGATSGSTATATATQYYNTGYASSGSNLYSAISTPSITLPANGYSKTGYTFNGWNTNSSGTGTNYAASVSYSGFTPAVDAANTKTLYAKWTANTYTINYMSPNLLYGMENVSTTTASSGLMQYSITDGAITVTALANDGYGFTTAKVDLVAGTEYSFSGTCSKTWGTNCEMFVMLESNTGNYIRVYNSTQTITPTASGTYLIRLDSNVNGDSVTFSNMSITKKLGTSNCTYDSSCTLTSFSNLGGIIPHSSSDTLRESRSWSFRGWSTSRTGVSSTVDYTDSQEFTYLMTNDITLYPRARRKIYFYSGIAPTTRLAEPYQYWNPIAFDNSNTTTVTLPTATSINNWNFTGYRIGSNAANASVTFDSTKVGTNVYFPVAKSRTIRSVYNRTLTLSFDKNGGSGTVSSLTATQYYNSGYLSDGANTGANVSTPSFTLPAANGFTAPTGKGFAQWNTNSSGTGTNYNAGASYTFAPDVDNTTVTNTLYARWVYLPTGSVTIVPDGTFSSGSSTNTSYDSCYSNCMAATNNYSQTNCADACEEDPNSYPNSITVEYVTSTSVSLTLSSITATQVCISNSTSCSDSDYQTYATSKTWTLSTGDGTKTVYVWFKDQYGLVSATYATDSILMDTTGPDVQLSIASGTSNGTHFGYKTLSISATATDTGIGLASIKTCKTTSSSCTPSTTGSNGVGTVTFTSNVNKQRMCYEAVDKAGNITANCDPSSYNVGITLYDYLLDNNVTGLHETYIGTDDLYRFSGTTGNSGVKNYICLGTSTKCSVSSANMYRIIGVEPSTGNIKVIRRSSAGSAKWHTTDPSSDDLIWTGASLFTTVKNTWYTNLDSNIKKYVVSHKWYIGKVRTGTIQSASSTRANAIADEEASSTTQYVGIMSVSDWLMSYRGDQNYWNDPGTTNLWIGLDNNGCTPSSSDKCHEWTMSRSYVWDATNGLAVWRTNPYDGGLGNYYTSNTFRYRPTYYIDKKTLYVSGTGTSSDPFMVDLAIAS